MQSRVRPHQARGRHARGHATVIVAEPGGYSLLRVPTRQHHDEPMMWPSATAVVQALAEHGEEWKAVESPASGRRSLGPRLPLSLVPSLS